MTAAPVSCDLITEKYFLREEGCIYKIDIKERNSAERSTVLSTRNEQINEKHEKQQRNSRRRLNNFVGDADGKITILLMQKRVCGDHLVIMIDPANDEEESWRSLGDHDHSRGNEAQILQGVCIVILFHQGSGIL